MASRFFAMLCHSWIYQPNGWNKSLSVLEMMKDLLRHGQVARRAISQALRQNRDHRRSLEELALK